MKPDTPENHYDNLLVGAEDWAIEQVKEDIQRLEKENAELKAASVDLILIGRTWMAVWGDKLSPESMRLFIEAEEQILKHGSK